MRQGYSPSFKLSRVLGIEAVGIVESGPGSDLQTDDIVATAVVGIAVSF
jgi:hypothetical protein